MTQPSSFSYEQLLACGRGELFGDANARLPQPPMLMFDRITLVDHITRACCAPRWIFARICGFSNVISKAIR